MKRWLLTVVALLPACVDGGTAEAPRSAPFFVRLVKSQEISSFVGDVEVIWYSHIVAPIAAPGSYLTILSQTDDCPLPGAAGRAYKLFLRWRLPREPILMRGDRLNSAWASDRVVWTCIPLPDDKGGAAHPG